MTHNRRILGDPCPGPLRAGRRGTGRRTLSLVGAVLALPVLVACGGDDEAPPAASEDQNASASATASASPTATGTSSGEAQGQEKDSTDQPSPVSAADYPDQLGADSPESQSLDQALDAVDAARAAQPAQKPSASPASEGAEGAEPTGVEVDTSELKKHFADAALEEVSAELGEMSVNGWHVSGSPAVVGQPRARSTRHDGQDAREVSVCLDSSQVSVTDDQGNPVEAGTSRDRVMNLYTLVQKDGAWVVVDHSFPQNTSC